VVLQLPLQLYKLFHNLPAWSAYITGCFNIAYVILLTLVYLAFLRVPLTRWIQVVLALAAIGILYGSMETARAIGTPLSFFLSALPQLSMFVGVIPVLLILHWRRGNREAGILLFPVIVNSLSIYVGVGGFLLAQIPALAPAVTRFQQNVFNQTVGPFTINLGNLGGCLFALSFAIILVLRSTRIAAQQAHLETEMAAAREVQQILVPEQADTVPGFVVESAYEPAQEVGGDFFQIMPAPEGSLLIVIGDVAGKGLPAAMLVSVLVGAIRGVTEYTSSPAELLANLNQRLVGRVASNLTTAVAARIFPDGAVELANAGHLPPYLDGNEVDVPGALPLGAKAGTQYETVRFQLPRGCRLTFYSDGIVEAQNAARELFGFERSRSIAAQPVATIVETARLFGQHDDMTAISITRAAAEAPKRAAAAIPELGVVTP
jgi:phosphoserine phosphatase RsbU/P